MMSEANLPVDAISLLKDAVKYIDPNTFGSYVYFLMKDGECVYVGQTKRLAKRIRHHTKERTKDFETVLYIHVPDDVRLEHERNAIRLLKPKHNGKPGPQANKGKDPLRTIRVSNEQWNSWKEVATSRGISVSRLIRDTMEEAINNPETMGD